MSPVTHLAENEHVPDFAAFSVGSQLLLDFLWMTDSRREREVSLFPLSCNGETHKLAVPRDTCTRRHRHTCTKTMSHLCTPASWNLFSSSSSSFPHVHWESHFHLRTNAWKKKKTTTTHMRYLPRMSSNVACSWSFKWKIKTELLFN